MEGLLQNPRRLPPTGKGQEGSARHFLSPDLVLQGGLPGLNPQLFRGESHHVCAQLQGWHKGRLRPPAQTQSLDRPSLAPSLYPAG